MIDPDQYDGFATPEELNLTPEEIQEFRTNKKYLTAQATQKLRKLKAKQQTQELLNAAHRIADGGVPLGKLIREGHQDPMTTRVSRGIEMSCCTQSLPGLLFWDACSSLNFRTGLTGWFSWRRISCSGRIYSIYQLGIMSNWMAGNLSMME